MTTRTRNDPTAVLSALVTIYAPARIRVDAAQERMREVRGRRHRPVEARDAARDLTLALRDATAAVVDALRVIDAVSRRANARGGRAPNVRSHDVVGGPWSAELVRLSEIGVWLRRETQDDVGVLPATTVRVGSRAASGPHIAGMEAEPRDLVAATLHEPRIGVDLVRIIDDPAFRPRHREQPTRRGAGRTRAA